MTVSMFQEGGLGGSGDPGEAATDLAERGALSRDGRRAWGSRAGAGRRNRALSVPWGGAGWPSGWRALAVPLPRGDRGEGPAWAQVAPVGGAGGGLSERGERAACVGGQPRGAWALTTPR